MWRRSRLRIKDGLREEEYLKEERGTSEMKIFSRRSRSKGMEVESDEYYRSQKLIKRRLMKSFQIE